MLVVPAYNERECLPELFNRLGFVATNLKSRKIDMTLVLVDDSSSDGSDVYLGSLGKLNYDIIWKRLSCNVGHQQALWEGLDEFDDNFNALIFMDADLQDPPEVICDLVSHWLDDWRDLIIAVRSDRKSDTFFKRFTSKHFYSLMNLFTEGTKRRHLYNAGDFRLLDKSLVIALKAYRRRSGLSPLRFLTMEISCCVGVVHFIRAKRFAGKSKYGLIDMLRLGFESVYKSGHAANRILQMFSISTGLGSFVITVFLLVNRFFYESKTSPGWISLSLLSLTAIFIQSTLLLILSSELKAIRKAISVPRVFVSESSKTIRIKI